MKILKKYLNPKSKWHPKDNISIDNIEITNNLDKEYSEEDIKNAIANWKNEDFIHKIKKLDIKLRIGKDGSSDKIILDIDINKYSNIDWSDYIDISFRYNIQNKHLMSVGVSNITTLDKLWEVNRCGNPIIETIKNLENYIEINR